MTLYKLENLEEEKLNLLAKQSYLEYEEYFHNCQILNCEKFLNNSGKGVFKIDISDYTKNGDYQAAVHRLIEYANLRITDITYALAEIERYKLVVETRINFAKLSLFVKKYYPNIREENTNSYYEDTLYELKDNGDTISRSWVSEEDAWLKLYNKISGDNLSFVRGMPFVFIEPKGDV